MNVYSVTISDGCQHVLFFFLSDGFVLLLSTGEVQVCK